MTGPWTPTGKSESKNSRTWWVVGGVIVALLALFAAYLMGRGWDEATGANEETQSSSSVVVASTVPDNVTDEISSLLRCSREMVCAGLNNARLEKIRSSIAAVHPREASVALSEAIGDWQRAYSIYNTQWCQQEEFEVCDVAADEMDESVWQMKQIVG